MAKIWQINETFTQNGTIGWSVEFTSNGRNFISLGCETYLMYGYTNTSGQTELLYLTTPSNRIHTWRDPNTGEDTSAYRTITFETAPTGELLTWLQANAVQQGGASQTTVLLLNVNVIKAGSSITVEAVNASTMGYITGTVGTITDTVTQLI